MMTKDEALKMAIEAMNSAYSSHGKILTSMPAQDAWLYHGCDAKLFKALQACKEALEQPAQEPVAFCKHGVPKGVCTLGEKDCNPTPSWQGNKKFVGLSEEEMMKLANKYIDLLPNGEIFHFDLFARAIEQELKTKNGFSGLKEKNNAV